MLVSTCYLLLLPDHFNTTANIAVGKVPTDYIMTSQVRYVAPTKKRNGEEDPNPSMLANLYLK